MNKSLTTNILLFFLIKITFLTLYYVNIMEFVYGHDLIFLHDLDITDGYKIEFIQFSENLQILNHNLVASSRHNHHLNNKSDNNNHLLITCNRNHHYPHYYLSNKSDNNNHLLVTCNPNCLIVSQFLLCQMNYKDCLWIYHNNFQMIYFVLIQVY